MKSKVLNFLKFVVIATTIIVIIGLFWWFSTANKGSIGEAQQFKSINKKVGYNELNGKYIYLQYANNYFIQKLPATDNDLELYTISANTAYTKQLVVSVTKLPDNKLENNSAYMLRNTRTDLYTERVVETKTLKARVWTRNDNQEQTAILEKDSKVAVLSFVQQGGEPYKLNAEVNTLLRSFEWR